MDKQKRLELQEKENEIIFNLIEKRIDLLQERLDNLTAYFFYELTPKEKKEKQKKLKELEVQLKEVHKLKDIFAKRIYLLANKLFSIRDTH
jgi:hypothetical protein